MGFYPRRPTKEHFLFNSGRTAPFFRCTRLFAALAFVRAANFQRDVLGCRSSCKTPILVQANYSGAVMTPRRRLEKNLGFCPQAEKRADSGPTSRGMQWVHAKYAGRRGPTRKPYKTIRFFGGPTTLPLPRFKKNPRADKGRQVADTPLFYKNQEIMWSPNTRWRSICYPPWSPKVAAVGRASH